MPTVNTKSAPRRPLSFACTSCLKAELDRIETANARGTLGHTGNWTPAEILDHVALTWEFAFDGWPSKEKPNLLIKLFARMMKKRMVSGQTLPAGFRYGKAAAFLDPRKGVAFDVAMARLRKVIARVDSGERMTAVSPAFGALTHEEWLKLHLGHSQLHLGFIKLAG